MGTGSLSGAGGPCPTPSGRAVLVLYHALGAGAPDGSRRFTITVDHFRRHLDVIQREMLAGGLRARTLRDWWPRAQPGESTVVLCFDDGGRSDFELALPLLAEAGIPATFFVNTALIGHPGYLDWNEVRAMGELGMDVESHGHQHVALTRLPGLELERQLRTSRHILQERTGKPVHFLAAPYGFWNQRVLETALAVGYRGLCISRAGAAAPAPSPVLPRNAVRCDTSARQLQAWLRQHPVSFAGRLIYEYLTWMPKQIALSCRPRWPAANGLNATLPGDSRFTS